MASQPCAHAVAVLTVPAHVRKRLDRYACVKAQQSVLQTTPPTTKHNNPYPARHTDIDSWGNLLLASNCLQRTDTTTGLAHTFAQLHALSWSLPVTYASLLLQSCDLSPRDIPPTSHIPPQA